MTFNPVPPNTGTIPATTPTILDLHSIQSEEAKLIHLLLGFSEFECSISTKKIKQRTNYAILGAPTPKGRRASALTGAINAQAIDIDQLNTYLKNGLVQNKFFGEIFDEFARYFCLSSEKKHTHAFLHLYRALERMSYSFPIAYATKSHDFKGTYAQFRSFFTNEKTGELGFFKAFVNECINSADRQTRVVFYFSANNIVTQNSHAKAFRSQLASDQILSAPSSNDIETSYDSLLSAMINIRNRYFHFASGNRKNLTGIQIPDPDEFFMTVNEQFANWLSFIYFRVLEIRSS